VRAAEMERTSPWRWLVRWLAPRSMPPWQILLLLACGFIAGMGYQARGQTITDADTLRQAGTTYRLHGIDSPELAQACPDGWPAGRLAASRLQQLTTGKTVICQERDRDRYGRIVAVCFANGADIGARMVLDGMALAYRRYSLDYVPQEDRARAEGLGVHAHGCAPAWEWRREKSR
jgi:endonuclease YncB( thermonuclease family)